MKLKAILTAILCLAFSFSLYAQESSPSWEKDLARLETLEKIGLNDDEQCQMKFDILWRHAKAGNIDAHVGLMFYLWGFMHMDHNFMPGHSDMVSFQRDRAIVAVHAIAAREEKGEDTDFMKDFLFLGLSENLKFNVDYYSSKIDKFLQCYDEEPQADKCVDLAVKEGLVPPWEVYVAEIDALIAKGYKPTCEYYHRDHWRNKGTMIKDKLN
jgi:hypothetical protein